MRLYPKIETLYDRGDGFKVDEERLRRPEFAIAEKWLVTEKVDGTNVRIGFTRDTHDVLAVEYNGRSDEAQMPPKLTEYLAATFTTEKLDEAFPDLAQGGQVVLFGEGYGPKIQKGGIYRNDIAVRLFDVVVDGWWLNWDNVTDVADKLEVAPVPVLDVEQPMYVEDAVEYVKGEAFSFVAAEDTGREAKAEGVVARTDPLLLCRDGSRLMWKLKRKDFGPLSTGGERV